LTLPTGVSTVLLECLDEHTSSDSPKTYSSPETFRDDDLERFNFYSVDFGKYKNSTLLDSSKAVTIDKIPEISNLSAILEPVPEDFPDQCIRRERPSNCYYSSSTLSISTTLAGKKLCKITAARERTTDLKSCICCASPLGPESKHDNQTTKAKRLEKKESSLNPLEGGSSSFRQLDASENVSARSEGLTAEVLPIKPSDAVEPLCDRQEICSIVRMSPCQRPFRLQQVPVNWKEICFPIGVPEDTITSTKNWICRKQK
ncbi:MEIKN protein, partial [Catharus fuscescens]|nr:MEIKN protein [Catharus fuscescens]